MSEPEWLGPASDCLEEHFSAEAADYLRATPALLALLERAVDFLERAARVDGEPMSRHEAAAFRARRRAIIADYRGYYREEFVAEAAPAPTVRGVAFTEDEMRYIDMLLGVDRGDP